MALGCGGVEGCLDGGIEGRLGRVGGGSLGTWRDGGLEASGVAGEGWGNRGMAADGQRDG